MTQPIPVRRDPSRLPRSVFLVTIALATLSITPPGRRAAAVGERRGERVGRRGYGPG